MGIIGSGWDREDVKETASFTTSELRIVAPRNAPEYPAAMEFEPFRYMAWAKRWQKEGQFPLHQSGVPPASLSDLGVDPAAIRVTPPAPGDPAADMGTCIGERYGVPAACVLPTCGTHHANFLLARAVAGPGVRVVVERPYYEAVPGVFRMVGAEVSFFDRQREDGWRLPTAEIRRAMEDGVRVVAVTDLHNPTGVRIRPDEFAALDAAAKATDALVLVDEVYRDFAREPVGTCFYEGGPFVVTSSLTKVYGLGALRFGWAIANPDLRERMRELNEFVVVNMPAPVLTLAAAAWDALPGIARRNRERAETNARVMAAWMRGHPHLGWTPPDAGISAFVEIPGLAGRDDVAWCAKVMAETGVGLVPGSMFGSPGSVRISWGLETEPFREGLGRLESVMGEV